MRRDGCLINRGNLRNRYEPIQEISSLYKEFPSSDYKEEMATADHEEIVFTAIK
jgi:hypothetical protein